MGFSQATIGGSIVFQIGGLSVNMAQLVIRYETDVVEYKDGDDAVVRYRPGRQKTSKIRVEKDWSNTQEFFAKIIQGVLGGQVSSARKSGSIVVMNDAGQEAMREDFGAVGDCIVDFPATGMYTTNPFSGIGLTLTPYLTKQNVIHRDLAARNVLLPSGFTLQIAGFSPKRTVVSFGTSALDVHVTTGDLDGDGVPDVVRSISASPLSFTVGGQEASFVQKWQDETDAAALLGVPATRHMALSWSTSDGTQYRCELDATLRSVTPQFFTGLELVCAVESVKFSRVGVNGALL